MFLLLLCFFLATAGPSSPDRESDTPPAADTLLVLPEITVTATRTPHAHAVAPARVTVLDREDVVASGSRNVAELLAGRSTGFIRFYGQGGLATLSLRGAAPSQTLLLIDGQRMSDPQTGQIDLSLLPSILLDDVEIVHGAGSALYGSDGMAGVVNLRTLPMESASSFAVRVGAGAFGERYAGGRVSQGIGRWRTGLAVEASAANGDFSVPRAIARRPNARRDGADRSQGSLYATARRSGDRHHLAVSAWMAGADRGLPGPVTTPNVGERQWDRQVRLWASDSFEWQGSQIRIGGGTHAASLRYLNPQLEIDDTGTSTGYFAEGTLTTIGPGYSLTTGGSADVHRARHPSRRTAAVSHAALFSAGSVGMRGLTAYPALRIDGYAAPSTGTKVALSPKLGLAAAVPAIASGRFKASIGRTFRAPTMNERYWQPGGNPDLRPERGWHADAGVTYARGRILIELSTFLSSVQDEIRWLRTPAGHYAPSNLLRTRSLGAELSTGFSASIGRRRHVNGGLVLTWTRATDRSDPENASFGQQLRYVPVVQAKANASFHAGPASLDLDGRYVGRRYVTTDGTESIDPYLIADVQLRLRRQIAGASMTFATALENVLNTRYAVIQYYPMPPRHLRFSLSVEINR